MGGCFTLIAQPFGVGQPAEQLSGARGLQKSSYTPRNAAILQKRHIIQPKVLECKYFCGKVSSVSQSLQLTYADFICQNCFEKLYSIVTS